MNAIMRNRGWKKCKKSINEEDGNVHGGKIFFKRDFTFIREMRVTVSL